MGTSLPRSYTAPLLEPSAPWSSMSLRTQVKEGHTPHRCYETWPVVPVREEPYLICPCPYLDSTLCMWDSSASLTWPELLSSFGEERQVCSISNTSALLITPRVFIWTIYVERGEALPKADGHLNVVCQLKVTSGYSQTRDRTLMNTACAAR